MSGTFNNTIFWVEVEKIKPNPFQPRKEFDESSLSSLADSIRQYGVLQPLVVTRKEVERSDGGMVAEYELISGERRLRASKLAGISQVPVVIRTGDETDQAKLELAIIENLQREDLNPLDRAEALAKMANEFNYTHIEIGRKIGKSREFVSNSIRLLNLSDEIKQALREGRISEGHTRPLLMLGDRPEEQKTLLTEIMLKRLSVRETERISRKIAFEKARVKHLDPELIDIEHELTEKLGTRVQIDKRMLGAGGKVTIDYTSSEDLRTLIDKLYRVADGEVISPAPNPHLEAELLSGLDDVPLAEKKAEEDTDLYAISNFNV